LFLANYLLPSFLNQTKILAPACFICLSHDNMFRDIQLKNAKVKAISILLNIPGLKRYR
jgi:hypothetical protein